MRLPLYVAWLHVILHVCVDDMFVLGFVFFVSLRLYACSACDRVGVCFCALLVCITYCTRV